MGVLKNRGQVSNMIRDYVYDATSGGSSNRTHPNGVDTNQVLTALTQIRNGMTTSPGSVRRTLNQLEIDGTLLYDDSVRPSVFRWNPNKIKPADYQHRPVTSNVPLNTGGTVSTPTMTDEQKRNQLRGKIKNRINEITGETEPFTVEETPVKPKRNPAKGITRTNGQIYQPRDLAGQKDVEALRKLREKGIFALLSGPPGTGKTVLVDAAFGDGPGGLYTITGNENTNTDDFLGQWSPDGKGGYSWVDGPLIMAMRTGGVLFIDDATLINPKVNAVAYPAMDGRNEVIVTSHLVERPDGTMSADVVKAKPGFYVAAAHNPGVHGAILTDALASRFIARIWVETDLQLAASLGVTDRFIKLVKALKVDQQKGQANIWIPQLRELLAARDMADVFNEEVAAANLLGQTPEDDQEWMADKMRVIFNKEIVPLEVGGQL
jgi:nitric oxide reductase NorQ protein